MLRKIEVVKMTRFERDLKDALAGNEIEVLTRRKAEIEKLTKEGNACKNRFRRQCIAQEVAKLTREYDEIDANF
jgi:hypothetical protein